MKFIYSIKRILQSSLKENSYQKTKSNHSIYYEPTSILFSNNNKSKDEWWPLWKYGMGGFFILSTLIYIYKPNTNLTTWALQEAKKRYTPIYKNDS
ncbi:hypothetical protein PCANB_000519 [Pneumocystis canis]|nr:hypothetical protein PCK1_000583 [Pneumocystis canis]KAG5437805.1 hypothetical protein PCANB_000519 [Pneumocystis canis]